MKIRIKVLGASNLSGGLKCSASTCSRRHCGYEAKRKEFVSKSSTTIDYLDLSIPIPLTSQEALEHALKRMKDSYLHLEREPRVKDGTLAINSNDFIAFLGYLNPQDLSEIELRRLTSNAEAELDQQLLRSVSVDKRAHYKWCVAAMKNFQMGRFL